MALNAPPPPPNNLLNMVQSLTSATSRAIELVKRRVERLEQQDINNTALGSLAVPFASLPTAGTSTGLQYLCTNCRKGGEGPGAGTGLMVFTDGTGTWKNVYNNLGATI